MTFWLRNIAMISILLLLAYFLFDNQDVLFSADESVIQADTTATSADAEKKENIPKKTTKKSSNAAADGLSKFYASINPDMNSKGPKIQNNIVYLPAPTGDLINHLEARRMVTRPYRASWHGKTEARPFRIGETLFQKVSEYAGNEGLEVIWWLERDFVVKDPFRINQNILDTAFQIGKSIEGHFENGISIFFCFRHRALVYIEEPVDYLTKECTLLSPKNKY